jgi:uncharacterized membrane protein YccC
LIIETVIGTLVSVLIAFLLYQIYSLRRQKKSLAMSFLQASIDRDAVSEKLKETVAMVNSTNVQDKDGFVKFLSESRDWAFSYIEEVQLSIKELESAIEGKDPQALLAAYARLIEHMPKEDNR